MLRGWVLTFFLGGLIPILRADDQVNALITPPDETEQSAHQIIETMFPYLNEGQRAEFEHALYPALDKNPQLITDGMKVLQEGGKKSGDATPADFEAYKAKIAAYEIQLRAAMVAEDPGVGQIFDTIDAHVKQQAAQ